MTHPTRARALALLAAAVTAPQPAAAQAPLPIRLGAGLDDGLTPILVAEHAGLFKKYGLDVTIVQSSNGAALAAAVAAGSVDIAKSAMMSLITAEAHGVHFKIVAGGTIWDTKSPTANLCVLTSSPIRSAGDLSGKTVAVGTLKSLEQMAIQAFIDAKGGNSATVRFIELQSSAMLNALEADRTDAASITNPVLQNVLETGRARSIGAAFDVLGSGFLEAAWFCSATFAQANPEAVARFGAAFREAAAYANGHRDETVGMLADYSKIEPDVIRKMRRDTFATGKLSETQIQPCIDAAYKYGYIAAPFSAKVYLTS